MCGELASERERERAGVCMFVEQHQPFQRLHNSIFCLALCMKQVGGTIGQKTGWREASRLTLDLHPKLHEILQRVRKCVAREGDVGADDTGDTHIHTTQLTVHADALQHVARLQPLQVDGSRA